MLRLNLCGKVRLIFKFKRAEIQTDFMKREHAIEQRDGDDMHLRQTYAGNYDYYHFHIEFYTPLRTVTKWKYFADSETGAAMLINNTLVVEKAVELRTHVAPVVWRAKEEA